MRYALSVLLLAALLLLPQVVMMQIQRQLNLPMASVMSLVLTMVVALAYLGLQRWLRMARL